VKSVVFVALAQIEAGAAGGARETVTLTACVATPALLLAVKVKLRVPTSATGGV
jgi:hypothetical protein